MMNKIDQEKKTVTAMIAIYCRLSHNTKHDLCQDCSELNEYAEARLDHCTFQNDKPVCSVCPVHCYKPDRREQIRQVMRFAGPRMILYHPVLVIKHLIDKTHSKR